MCSLFIVHFVGVWQATALFFNLPLKIIMGKTKNMQ